LIAHYSSLIFYQHHQKHREKTQNTKSHINTDATLFKAAGAAAVVVASISFCAMKENKAKMRYQRRVITSSRYLANIDFIITPFLCGGAQTRAR
jgi:KaiC/GvpD/RAD55 family RecA-like ATPase